MVEKKKKIKWKIEQKAVCPVCGEKIVFHYKEETVKKAVPAEKEIVFEAVKDDQSTLDVGGVNEEEQEDKEE